MCEDAASIVRESTSDESLVPRQARIRIVHTQQIKCAPERVWRCLHGTENQKKWLPGLHGISLSGSQPVKIGSRFSWTLNDKSGIVQFDGEITAHKKNETVAIAYWERGAGRDDTLAIRCDLIARKDRTRVDCVLELPDPCDRRALNLLVYFLVRMLMPLIKITLKLTLRKTMKAIKRLAEGQRAGEPD